MSSTQCKDTKSYEQVNEHTTGRNILTENYHINIKCRLIISLRLLLLLSLPVNDLLQQFEDYVMEIVLRKRKKKRKKKYN